MSVLIIDVGTQRTKATVLSIGGRPILVLYENGNWYIRTAVYVAPDGRVLIGDDALQQGYLDPSGYVCNLKRHLGSSANLLGGGRSLTAAEGISHIAKAVKEAAERATNTRMEFVCAVVPVCFRDDQKADLKRALEAVGLSVIGIFPEPSGAAAFFGLDRTTSPCRFVVIDVGAGTTDLSLLRAEGKTLHVLATEGLPIGGNDLDDAIESDIMQQLDHEFGAHPIPADDPLFFLEFRWRLEQFRIFLTTQAQVLIPTSWNGRHTVVKYARDQFERRIEPLRSKIGEALDRVLAAAGMSKQDLQHCICVGGPMHGPFLRDYISNHLGIAARSDVDADKATVYGAALLGAAAVVQQGLSSHLSNRIIPSPGVFVRDVTAHPVGCTVLERATGKLIHSAIIPKNTPIPCDRSEEYFLEHDDQSEALVEVLQGGADVERDACLTIGTLKLTNLPKEPLRTRRIRVTYSIDGNGMVTATATDKVGGQSKTASVGSCEHSTGVSPTTASI